MKFYSFYPTFITITATLNFLDLLGHPSRVYSFSYFILLFISLVYPTIQSNVDSSPAASMIDTVEVSLYEFERKKIFLEGTPRKILSIDEGKISFRGPYQRVFFILFLNFWIRAEYTRSTYSSSGCFAADCSWVLSMTPADLENSSSTQNWNTRLLKNAI